MGHRTRASDWDAFEERLADTLYEMQSGQFIVLDADHPALEDSTGATPYVQASFRGANYELEVSSNYYLDAIYQLDAEQELWLLANGWVVSPKTNHQSPGDGPRDAASRLRDALQFALKIPHPSVLNRTGGGHLGHAPDLDLDRLRLRPSPNPTKDSP